MLSLPRKRFTLASYFPYPKFQKKFLFLTLGISGIAITLVGYILYYFLSQNYEVFSLLADTDPEMGQIFMSEFDWMVGTIVAVFTTYFGFMIFLNFMISHSVAGVMYAFRRTIKELAEGKDTRLKLREKDEFLEIADEFNAMVDKLQSEKKQAS